MDGDGDGEASRYLQLARTRIDFGGRKSYIEAPRISLKLRYAATLAKHLFGGRFT